MWFKVDDKLHDHEKVRGLDAAAVGLWALAGSWCGSNGTDGFVPATVVPRWSKSWKRLAAMLVDRRLWEPSERGHEAGWVFVNWTEYQPTRQETAEPLERIRWRRKQALKKNRALCEQVVQRDRGRCRYCDIVVNWQDRKSAKGGTYDHVDPNGDNTLENVVVACRRCNGRKKDRTPHEAGMALLPEPGPHAPGSGSEITRSEPEESGASGTPAREAVRDQIGSGSVRVGSGPSGAGSDRVPAPNGAHR